MLDIELYLVLNIPLVLLKLKEKLQMCLSLPKLNVQI